MHLLIFIFGLLIGSFLNVCICRIPEEKSIAYPTSHCTKCRFHLKPMDLIPIFSFIAYRGRCKYCSGKISPQYPLVEIMNGILYLLLFIKFGFSIEFLQYALLSSLLVIIFGIDYSHQIIPDGLNKLILVLGILFHALPNFNSPNILLNNVLGFFVAGVLFLIIAVVTKGAMGGGDIKLMAVLGFWFGLKEVILITFLSFLLGGVLSVIILSFKIKEREDFIPFGPFIVMATIITIFYGNIITNWYISTFHLY
ncbi:prepilin peptidase [Alkaliphilus peptidifermentans]|uniref:Prepilin leader peptidase/N-methyltransferase n=1 Tax=Alkaliphilus peptidifermentans DSM 18978 TaxID=1120976 RepID=A0A1G5KCW4_9FIRM|nr:A24 family peptidase [Alkaliphilus peptidifermentans]SCY98463.1 type 4 prepilin peptidase 1 . Aspartic peptidase. MEROPS family A24A [Alkaliphilus peptidifermentans DSM 18978]